MPPIFGTDDATALRTLASCAAPGDLLRCDAGLADAGRTLGFRAGPPPEELVPLRAALALGISLGQLSEHVKNLWVFVELMQATAEFVGAAPWTHRSSDDPIAVTVTGPLAGRFEGSIMGGGGDEFGIALYTEPGTIARIVALVDGGRMRDAAHFDSIVVTIEDAPPLATEAVRAAFGVTAVPVPARVRKGKGAAVREEEALVLAAALRAAAALSPGLREATASVEVDGVCVGAHLAAPAPEAGDATAPRVSFTPVVARNAPCPCGSGRKYKKCHLPLEEATSDPLGHERDGRLVGVLGAHAEQRLGDRWTAAVAAGWPQAFRDDRNRIQLFVPWSVYECHVDGRTVLESYLAERGAALQPADRAWLEAQRRAWLSIWEVEELEPGTSVAVRDLLTGEARGVTERSGTRGLALREAILARVVDGDGVSIFCGCHPNPLPPREADRVVRAVRRRLRARGAVTGGQLKAPGASQVLIEKWEAAVKALGRRPPPRLANTDGEPLLLTTDHFEFAPAARAEIELRLAALEGVEGPERDGDTTRFTVLRPGNAMHRSWENTVVGTIRLTAGTLAIETNSVRRADRVRESVERTCGDLVSRRGRTHVDPSAVLRKGGAPAERPPLTEDVARATRAWKEQHYADWVDERIPALGGLTPREAVRTASGRRKVEVLLKEIEHGESRLPEGERFDVRWLRRELAVVERQRP